MSAPLRTCIFNLKVSSETHFCETDFPCTSSFKRQQQYIWDLETHLFT